MAEIKKLEYKLDEEAIVEITEFMDSWLKEHKVRSKNRTVFMLESMLLDIRAHYGEARDVTVSILKKLGRKFIKVVYEGDEFNPTGNEEASHQTQLFLANMGFVPSWSYKDKRNEIILEIPRNHLKDETFLLLAFVGSVLIGFAGPILPEVVKSFVSEYILGTVSDIFMSLLGVFAGILIFFSILSGVCGMESIADLSKKGKYMISRTLLAGIYASVICGLIMIPFFHFSYGKSDGNSGAKEIYSMIKDIIPSDPISPFLNGNMLQICLIAVLTGSVIIMLGNRVDQIRELVLQGNTLLISVVELVCRLLPLYIFADLTRLFWENGLGIIITTWKPILLCVAANAFIALFKLIKISIRYKTKVSVLFKKVYPSFMIGLTTASSMAAYGTSLEINETKLGIDPGYSSFATPLKNQIHALNSVLGFIISFYFLAEYSGISINTFWFVNVWIVVFLISPAIPPVSGGTLICIGIMLNEFGIPNSCLSIAATLMLLLDFFMTSSKIIVVHMEEVEEADHLGLLDKKILVSE